MPGAFETERQGQVALIEPAAQLGVEEVHARGFDLDENLAWPGRGQRQFLEHHRLRTAACMHTDRFHGSGPQSVNVTGCIA